MALQELDLHIVHHSGKKNANADALSQYPLPSSQDSQPTAGVVAAVTAVKQGTEDNTDDLAVLQRSLPTNRLSDDMSTTPRCLSGPEVQVRSVGPNPVPH